MDAAERLEHDAMARLSRVHGPMELRAAALALVAQPEPAAPTVILLDAWRADHGGSAFVRAYRRLPAGNAPIIVMTTGTRAEVSAAAEADGVLEKPFGLGVLFDLVAHHAA